MVANGAPCLTKEDKRARRDFDLRETVKRQAIRDMNLVGLSRHAFLSDEELEKVCPRLEQQRIVRAFELPKKEVPYAIEAASRRVEAYARATQEQKTPQINVENLMIQIPEKKAPELAGIVIDVEAK